MKSPIKIFLSLFVASMALASCGDDNNSLQIIIDASSNNEAYGSVSGGGSYEAGATVTLTAIPAEGCQFLHWDDGSTENPRVFNANQSDFYTAYFGKIPVGDGSCTVQWKSGQWSAAAVYAVSINSSLNLVTLEIYKDPSDPQAPMLVCQFPMEEGTFIASQENPNFMVLYFDYPNQMGSYNGQQMPLYQPTQGLYMTVDAIDPAKGVFSGSIEGQFLNVDEYGADPNNPHFYPLQVQFSRTQWLDMSSN